MGGVSLAAKGGSMRAWWGFACRERGIHAGMVGFRLPRAWGRYVAPCGQSTGAGRRAGPSTPRSRQIVRRVAVPSDVDGLLTCRSGRAPGAAFSLAASLRLALESITLVGGLYAGSILRGKIITFKRGCPDGQLKLNFTSLLRDRLRLKQWCLQYFY